jgi:hypothetical protein
MTEVLSVLTFGIGASITAVAWAGRVRATDPPSRQASRRICNLTSMDH